MPQVVPISVEDVKDLLAAIHPLDLAHKLCLRCPYTIQKWVVVGRIPAKYFHRLGEIIEEVAEKKKKEAEIAPSSDEIEFKEVRKELNRLEKAKLELMRARKARLQDEIDKLKALVIDKEQQTYAVEALSKELNDLRADIAGKIAGKLPST